MLPGDIRNELEKTLAGMTALERHFDAMIGKGVDKLRPVRLELEEAVDAIGRAINELDDAFSKIN